MKTVAGSNEVVEEPTERTALLASGESAAYPIDQDPRIYKSYSINDASGTAASNDDPWKSEHTVEFSTDTSLLTTALPTPRGTQNSTVTIFAIWNTMMGTSILTMPYAIGEAGLAWGIIIVLFMMLLCLYTANRVMNMKKMLDVHLRSSEFADVCQELLGRWAAWTSVFFSVVSLVGAVIVYWVLMSNFLFNSVTAVYNIFFNGTEANVTILANFTDVYCPEPVPTHVNLSACFHENCELGKESSSFEKVWTLERAPLFLLLLVAPLVNFKSATIFTKFNALGAVSVVVTVGFVITKSIKWGINVEFKNQDSSSYIPQFNSNFAALIGTLTLAYYIHNCINSVVLNQKHPENNTRDLIIAYCLVCATYLFVGILFYIAFPLDKRCIEDNLLSNLKTSDTVTALARFFLLMQMLTVLPLLTYVIRIQLVHQISPGEEPNFTQIVAVNVIVLTIAVMFAIFYPHISFMIRFTGALCGLAYTFTLPCLAYMRALSRRGELTIPVIAIHSCIISFGVVNFISQFFVTQRF